MAVETNPQNQGTFLNTVTFPELTDLVNRNFIAVGGMLTPVAKQLFINETVGAGEGELKLLQEYDMNTYARSKPQGVDAKKASFGIGYYITIQQKRIGMEAEITWEMRRYNKKQEVMATLTALPHFCPQRVELDLTHRLTFGDATTYTDLDGNLVSIAVGDTLALFSAVHLLKFSSTTYNNINTGNPLFSKGALEAAELIAKTQTLNNFGEKRVMDYNTIITGDNPTVCNAVKQFLNSTSDNLQNNPGVINVYQGSKRHVILPQLATTAAGLYDSTKKNYWFLAAIGNGLRGWQAYFVEWEAMNLIPSSTGNGVDVHKDIWYYNVRQSYNIGIVSGRGIIGSLPTS
jgi:hypothetical protein